MLVELTVEGTKDWLAVVITDARTSVFPHTMHGRHDPVGEFEMGIDEYNGMMPSAPYGLTNKFAYVTFEVA